MADLFECDKCGRVRPSAQKAGRLSLLQLGANGTHHNLAHDKEEMDLCSGCYTDLRDMMQEAKRLRGERERARENEVRRLPSV